MSECRHVCISVSNLLLLVILTVVSLLRFKPAATWLGCLCLTSVSAPESTRLLHFLDPPPQYSPAPGYSSFPRLHQTELQLTMTLTTRLVFSCPCLVSFSKTTSESRGTWTPDPLVNSVAAPAPPRSSSWAPRFSHALNPSLFSLTPTAPLNYSRPPRADRLSTARSLNRPVQPPNSPYFLPVWWRVQLRPGKLGKSSANETTYQYIRCEKNDCMPAKSFLFHPLQTQTNKRHIPDRPGESWRRKQIPEASRARPVPVHYWRDDQGRWQDCWDCYYPCKTRCGLSGFRSDGFGDAGGAGAASVGGGTIWHTDEGRPLKAQPRTVWQLHWAWSCRWVRSLFGRTSFPYRQADVDFHQKTFSPFFPNLRNAKRMMR